MKTKTISLAILSLLIFAVGVNAFNVEVYRSSCVNAQLYMKMEKLDTHDYRINWETAKGLCTIEKRVDTKKENMYCYDEEYTGVNGRTRIKNHCELKHTYNTYWINVPMI